MKYFIIAIYFFAAGCIWGCDMFALILTSEDNFSDHEDTVNEYFDFLISRSSASTNNDGYGIVAYRNNSRFLEETDYWYKTGYNTSYGDGQPDPMDDARNALLSNENNYFLVIAHARNATGGNGSHPFRIDSPQATFSMCHNGVIPSSLRLAIMEFLGSSWFDFYPSNWYGYYGNMPSFIDSELYLHYLVNSILENDYQVIQGIQTALLQTNLIGIDAADYFLNAKCSANFLFSDGIDLFAFKNTRDTSSYKMSWRVYGSLTGIRTQNILDNALQQNELIRFSPDGEINSIFLEYPQEEEYTPAPGFYASPNPARDMVDIILCTTRSDDNEDDDVLYSDKIAIYDLKGRKIRELTSFIDNGSFRNYHWDGKNKSGENVAAGIYLYRHNTTAKTGKLVFLK
jgi:predicted glutamine amidotransferase